MIACTFNIYQVAVMENGQVYSWGKNDEGQLGTGRLGSIQVGIHFFGNF